MSLNLSGGVTNQFDPFALAILHMKSHHCMKRQSLRLISNISNHKVLIILVLEVKSGVGVGCVSHGLNLEWRDDHRV